MLLTTASGENQAVVKDSITMGGTLSSSPEALTLDNERLNRGGYDPHFLCMRVSQIHDVFR